MQRWTERLSKIRQDSTFFYIVSSFANADILTLKYFQNLLETLDFDEFKLYHDRSANQYRKSVRDFATQLKHDLEFNGAGMRTGWMVQLMNVGQGNISHADEFNLMNILMGEKDKRLPKLLIDMFECRELKNQLEIAPVAKTSKNEIQKVKKGDKLPSSRLAMESTNFTDAFKYMMCRPKWVAYSKQKTGLTFGPIGVK